MLRVFKVKDMHSKLPRGSLGVLEYDLLLSGTVDLQV